MLPPANSGALNGFRVVDLTTVLMGPLAARILGDLGADVIRLESLEGDSSRNSLPARTPGMSSMAMNLQRNKRSIALDLKDPTARSAAFRLLCGADVVVTNMRRGALARLGLDPDTVRAAAPSVVYCVANGYGSDGPYADRPAYDDAIQAGSGISWLIGQVQDRPGYLPAIIADKVCGMTIAQAVLAALLHRARTGRGQTIEVPMLETMVAFNLIEHQRGATFDPPLAPFGYDRLLTPYRRPFRSADGWVALLPYNNAHWAAFFALCERPDLAADPRFADHNARIANVDALWGWVDEVAATRTTDAWVDACEAHGIPVMPVLDLAHAADDPHLAAVGLFEHVEHPTEGAYVHVRDAVRYSDSPSALRRFTPRLGEHTVEVLTEVGLDTTQIEALVASGAARTTAT